MGLLDLFTKKRDTKPQDQRYFSQVLPWGQTNELTSNQNDEKFIEQGFRKNPTVYSIVSTITKNAALAQWGIYKKMPDGTKKPYTDIMLKELLYEPNGLYTWNRFIQDAIGFKLLTGNTYIWGVPGAASGKVGALYVLPSAEVDIMLSDDSRNIMGYVLEYYGYSSNDIIPKEQVLHIRDFNPRYNSDGEFLYGQSPLQAAFRSLQTNNDAIDTSRGYLLNQGPRGILAMQMDDTFGEMSEEQINTLRSRFKRNHQGTKNAGDVLVAPGKWKWEDIGSSAADLKLIEHYNLTINDICNAYSFPTVLLGNGESTFSNQKEAKKALWSNVIIPALCELRDGLNQWLVPHFGEDICLDFDTSSIMELQEDLSTQAAAIAKLQNLITVNEARAMINLAPLNGPEGDEMFRFVQGVESDRNGEQTESDSQSEGSEEGDG